MRYFVGIDPGKAGGLALITESGRIVEVVDTPLNRGRKETGHYDPVAIFELLRRWSRLPKVRFAVEWNQCRPSEGAQRSRNVGLGLGYLEMALIALTADWERVSPQKWKNKLSLPGKSHPKVFEIERRVFNTYFPDQEHLILGPRGGLKDGRMEAVLIAEYLRRGTMGGMKATVERFGTDSVEAMALVLGTGQRKRLRNS